MFLKRRLFLLASPVILTMAKHSLAHPSSHLDDKLLSPRTLGNPKAPVIVDEWFSLTCSHCAHFATHIFPFVKTNLIDTGKILFRFHDFPLDQVALLAAMVARFLPEEQYAPFLETLFKNQDQWAFSQDIDPVSELKKYAILAGISDASFENIKNNQSLKEAIINRQDKDDAFLHIQGTPYFRVNDRPAPNIGLGYDEFLQTITKAL
ncbi:thioredoxin domain-containing protein [Swingsia samuiensis]|uniref:Thiol:disulfide interchange protein n=1 Tax=Swingsia samuiensis TaxID=1293412 RepID=A0A4Y6UJ94_9PROT|nr:thioredoxin domain-containing protein [Swingsia samuiensis]QDH17673.1 thiol:disulfide interchange protein [Swingsia samuiensis]